MECDHLEEVISNLRAAIRQDADVGRISRDTIDRALRHAQAAMEDRARVAEAIRFFDNVSNFTTADIVKRIGAR